MHESTPASVVTRIVPGVVDVVVLAPVMDAGVASDVASGGASGVASGVASGAAATQYMWRVLTLKRGANTRCTGAWEIVHGRIEAGERPEQAAVRELFEETGLRATRLYNVTVNSFYLHQTGTVQLALVFAAVVEAEQAVVLGSEHSESAWHSMSEASDILAWPREREALVHVQQLLKWGDAGPVEDVLRIF